jgi:transcriptional regulator with XRE-family HTH domain
MVGKIIRKLRLEKGITQNELSNYLGLTPKMVSFYELGERFPPYDIILKLADYFNVSTDYLLGRSIIKNAEELLTDYNSLSEPSKKDLEEFIQILKLKDLEKNKTI